MCRKSLHSAYWYECQVKKCKLKVQEMKKNIPKEIKEKLDSQSITKISTV